MSDRFLPEDAREEEGEAQRQLHRLDQQTLGLLQLDDVREPHVGTLLVDLARDHVSQLTHLHVASERRGRTEESNGYCNAGCAKRR